MAYSIVWSSGTGNTAKLAEVLRAALPASGCRYCGGLDGAISDVPVVLAGFWTNRGSCDEKLAAFLKTLEHKQVFLFGTAGFGGSQDYYEAILNRVRANLPASSTLIGSYMCQGQMPAATRQRYEKLLTDTPGDAHIMELLENFDRAAGHPNEADCASLRKLALGLPALN